MPDCRDPRGNQSTISLSDHQLQAVADGMADIAAGRFLSVSDIEACLDRLWIAVDAPVPQSTAVGSR